MSANASGIQALLEAEKEAAKIVAKARQCTYMRITLNKLTLKDRVQRLKDAKAEAQKEIDQIKSAKEKEFQAFMQQTQQSAEVDQANKETEEKLISVKKCFEEKRAEVSAKLLETIYRVEPRIHVPFDFTIIS